MAVVGALVAVVVIGSVSEISAQSAGYRRATDTAYSQLASIVVEDSNQTGDQLASLMASAAQLPDGPVVPNGSGVQPLAAGTSRTARARLQQGLDQAVAASSQQAVRARSLVPPYPTGSVSPRFIAVMRARAASTSRLRSIIDGLLGMEPLPVAGSPPAAAHSPPPAPLSVAQAAPAMAVVGQALYYADSAYGDLVAYVRREHIPVRLPPSHWVSSPPASAPLGPQSLGATASALSASPVMAPWHQMVITAIGLTPPAVTTGAAGLANTDCQNPASTAASATPTVLPPTTSVSVAATVTNCGTVTETGVTVTQTLTLADPPGTKPPSAGARGGRSHTTVTLPSGGSVALALPAMTVATGHLYNLVVAIDLPPGQTIPSGSSQAFLVQISS